jgi:hypothetical protein
VPQFDGADTRSGFEGSDLIDAACLGVTALLAVAVVANERNAIRIVAAIIFTLFVPGRAVISNWPILATRSPIAASILFSLTILTFVATITLWSDLWRPIGLLEVECAVSTAALIAAIMRRRAAPGPNAIEIQNGQHP